MNTVICTQNTPIQHWFAYIRSRDWYNPLACRENTRSSFVEAIRYGISRSKAFFEVANKLTSAGHALDWSAMHKTWFDVSEQLNSGRCTTGEITANNGIVTKQINSADCSAPNLKGKLFVVDGTNLFYGSSFQSSPSIMALFGLLIHLEEQACEFKCFFDANSTYLLKDSGQESEAEFLKIFCRECKDSFITVAGGNRADDFLLDYAGSVNATVISNDLFRPYHQKHPWLVSNSERRASFIVHSGIIQIPTLSVQAKIPKTYEELVIAVKACCKRSGQRN